MSNWGRNYNANRNQNSVPNYSQGDGSRSFESWADYSFPPASEGTNDYFTQNNTSYAPIGGDSCNGELNFPLSEYYQSGATPNIPLGNYEINSDIWARAANSQLTPTAGEFIPSATYTFQPQGRPSSASQSNHIQRTQDPNYPNNDIRPRSYVTPVNNSHVQHNTFSQGRTFDKSKNRGSDSGRISDNVRSTDNGRRMLNIEQSKAEGRKKLLQEVAGISQKQNDTSSHSGACGEVSFSGWSRRGSSDKGSQHAYRNNDARVYSRSGRLQDHRYQDQRYSPARKSTVGTSPHRSNTNKKGVDDAASQRDRLTEQLNRSTLECLVCCEVVRQTDQTWSCHNCYHVLHLRCTIKWATTSKADNGWRCPACQNVTISLPKEYYCFCGKTVNPDWSRTDTAHSCGETCNRAKVLASAHYRCVHRCTLLCHPGPCPPCVALVTRKCGCGATSQKVQCGQLNPLLCDSVCNKPLSCGKHKCENKCHLGECQPCQIVVKQVCTCGKESREVGCAEEGHGPKGAAFECGAVCERQLSCGQHNCSRSCHVGSCGPCQRDPLLVTHCYCGKTPLLAGQPRTSCLDPIPTCAQTCSKRLTCGQPSHPHECCALCHEGPCPPCEQTTLVRCRCGHMDQEIPCTELTTKADDARCKKKCTKKRACGKHKCNLLCCIDVDHVCPMVCNHMLSCGNHRCDQLCHRGHCQPCLQSRFEELYCECRSSVLMPPIPCGTKPPPCNKPCSRVHSCEHQVLHECHSLERCPPCTVLTAKHCHGKHELRKAVPCHLKAFSCGLACGCVLSCGRHKCIQPCHEGECSAVCRQPCTRTRDLCGHQCNSPCHDGDCPDTPCKEKVVVSCECGHRNMSRPCFENNNEYQRIATSLLASKMADVQLGRSVNINDMQGPRKFNLKTLECSEECRVMERNRRLAIGLQIRNPDLSAKLTPRYSDFMRAWAKKDQRFCQHVHDKLTELVKLAKESKQKSRSYSFETMNREKRQFVHEYCTHFGCESIAYDAEPKRNVVATAQRDKAWLPSYSLQEVVQREMGQRRVPVPSLNSSSQKPTSQSNVLPVRVPLNQPQLPKSDLHVDYFDYNNS